MKKVIIALITFFVVITGVSQNLTVATFNCEFLVESKVHVKYGLKFNLKDESESIQNQWRGTGFRETKFKESCEKVAEQIKLIDADIIGLTEVGNSEDFAELRSKLAAIDANYNYYEICKSTDKTTGQHVAILSRYPLTLIKKKFVDRTFYFPESDLDECKETGISKGMHIKAFVDNKYLDILLVHLKSERGGSESDAQRIAQAEIIRREVLRLHADTSKLVIVMGDLNSEKRHKTLQRLRGFDDIYREMIQTGEHYYFSDVENRWTYSYQGKSEQIDHILLTHDFKEICKKSNGISTSIIKTTDPLVSDHHAIKVEFNFKE